MVIVCRCDGRRGSAGVPRQAGRYNSPRRSSGLKPPQSILDEIDRADRALRSANLLIADGDIAGAVERAYYAAFHAARAALLSRGYGQTDGQAMPKTHDGLTGKFSQEFVKTGDIPMEIGIALKQIENRRNIAEYSGDRIEPEVAPEILAKAACFVSAIKEMTVTT